MKIINMQTIVPGVEISFKGLDGYETYCEGTCVYIRPKWVKVKDGKPENYASVLMTYNDFVMEGEYVRGDFYHPSLCAHIEGFCICEPQEGITHWMPLPEPPKELNDLD